MKLLPKIKILANNEGNTRKSVSDILKTQEIELETYSNDEGMLNTEICLSYVLYTPIIFFLITERTELQHMHVFELLATLLQVRGKMKILQRFNVSLF